MKKHTIKIEYPADSVATFPIPVPIPSAAPGEKEGRGQVGASR